MALQRNGGRPAYERVANAIRERILAGELRPGDRLPVPNDLAQSYAVSRSTVREALRTLESESLLFTTRGVTGGTFVSTPEMARITEAVEAGLDFMACAEELAIGDLLEARELLEVPAARLAAGRRSESQLDALHQALEQEAAALPGNSFESSKSFHGVILEAAGNRLLEVMTQPVFSILRTRFLRDEAPERFWFAVHEEHLLIADAIEGGHAEVAAEEMRKHLNSLSDTYTSIDLRLRGPEWSDPEE